MKKLIIFIIGIFLFSAIFVTAIDLPDFPKMSFNLKKGWNMVPTFGGPESYGGSCGENDFIYILNPLNKKYFPVGPYSQTSEFKSLAEQGYYAAYYGGIWFYVSEDCDIWMKDFVGPSNFKMAQGWQFVAKRNWADDFGVFKNCNVEKFNMWDNEAKKWAYTSSSTSVTDFQDTYNQAKIGEVFAVKFSSECALDEMEITSNIMPQPPAVQD